MMVNEEPTSLELMHDPKSIYGANMSWLNVVVSHDVGINDLMHDLKSIYSAEFLLVFMTGSKLLSQTIWNVWKFEQMILFESQADHIFFRLALVFFQDKLRTSKHGPN